MSWTDRIREAAYTSPSGERITFSFGDVRRQVDRRTAEYVFPGVNGTYVQDLGRSGRRYPFRMFFNGEDHDLTASRFEDLLLEPGVGRLEHPFYGAVDVIPTGTINRRDDLVTAANQTIIETSFSETLLEPYPRGVRAPGQTATGSVDIANTQLAEDFASGVDFELAEDRVDFRGSFDRALSTVETSVEKLARAQAEVEQEFRRVFESINTGIDVLIADPLTLAFQTLRLVQLPAQAEQGVSARLNAYGNLLDDMTRRASDNRNSFMGDRLIASSAVLASLSTVIGSEFDTRPQTIEAAESIAEQFDTFKDWQDERFNALGIVDEGGGFQQLQEAVAITTGLLVDISFTVVPERSLTLDRDRSIIDLAYELYGSVDDRLDFFIESNSFTGSEILEVPRGRRVVYYI